MISAELESSLHCYLYERTKRVDYSRNKRTKDLVYVAENGIRKKGGIKFRPL